LDRLPKLKAAIGRLIVGLWWLPFAVNIALSLTDARAISKPAGLRFWELLAGAHGLGARISISSGLKHVISLGGHGSHLMSREIVCIGDALSRLARFAPVAGSVAGHPGRIKCRC